MFKVVYLAILLGGTLAYEIPPRTNRIRFPSNEPPPQNYFGPQIFTAESQDSPMIRVAPNLNGNMFNIVPQIPSHSKPFGEENKKGFSQGLIYNQQEDFYHPVPPPSYHDHQHQPMKNFNKFSNFNNQKRLPERHRFSPQRFNMHAAKPFSHPQKLFNPNLMSEKPKHENFNHEFMDVFSSFKRPQNYNDGHFQYEQKQKDFEEFDNYKKPVHSRPHIMIQKPQVYKQQSFNEQDYPEDMDYQDYKRRPNIEVTHEQMKFVPNHKEPNYLKTAESSHHYRATEPNYKTSESNYNYKISEPNYKAEPNYKDYEEYDPKEQKLSGEWIPINAPEGALPAKSYDIPAPDLSVRYHEEDYDERPQKSHYRVQRPSNVVYGGRKKAGNEEVVSASVMVKQ